MLVYCKDDDEASGSQEGSSGGRSHLVEQFTGVGIKVFPICHSHVSCYICFICVFDM